MDISAALNLGHINCECLKIRVNLLLDRLLGSLATEGVLNNFLEFATAI